MRESESEACLEKAGDDVDEASATAAAGAIVSKTIGEAATAAAGADAKCGTCCNGDSRAEPVGDLSASEPSVDTSLSDEFELSSCSAEITDGGRSMAMSCCVMRAVRGQCGESAAVVATLDATAGAGSKELGLGLARAEVAFDG